MKIIAVVTGEACIVRKCEYVWFSSLEMSLLAHRSPSPVLDHERPGLLGVLHRVLDPLVTNSELGLGAGEEVDGLLKL